MKILPLLLICVLLMGAKCTQKYSAPDVEVCTILVDKDDNSTCFCGDNRLTDIVALAEKVNAQMNGHHAREATLDYLFDNEVAIVKDKFYEFHIQYCRGYQAIGPEDQSSLEIWAENNRVERIKSESDLKKKKKWFWKK